MINCKVCRALNRKEIELKLIKGDSYTSITKEHGISYSALKKHKENHLIDSVAEGMATRDFNIEHPPVSLDEKAPALNNIADCIGYLHEESLYILGRAKKNRRWELALKAIKQDLECIAMGLKAHEITAAYDAQRSWDTVLPKILKAVDKYSEAKIAISRAIYDNEESYGELLETREDKYNQ